MYYLQCSREREEHKPQRSGEIRHHARQEHRTVNRVHTLHQEQTEIRRCAFQSVNLTAETKLALEHTYRDCLFIGCTLPLGLKKLSKDCLFLPDMGETFHYRNRLYTPEELYEGYSPEDPHSYHSCYDGRVYRHYLKMGKHASNVKETLARSMHDHSISDCLREVLSHYDEHKLVGVMGGHGLLRGDATYLRVAMLSKHLTEDLVPWRPLIWVHGWQEETTAN